MSIDAKIRPYTKLDEFKSEALHPADFTIRQDGVVRLNPGLARRVVQVTTHRI
jgi:hypothetical protein